MKCSNCGKSVSDESYYCNNCGFFLFSSKNEITFKNNKCNELKDFKNVLYEFSNIIENKEGRLSAKSNVFESYTELVWSYLLDITNIKEKIDFSGINYILFLGNIMKIMDNLKDVPKDRIADEFLHKLNFSYKKYKNSDDRLCKFIFYTNILLPSDKRDEFNTLLKKFNLNLFNWENFKFNVKDKNAAEMLKSKFKSDFILIEYLAIGKNDNVMKQTALNQLYSFFGFLSFGFKYFRGPNKWNINELSLNHSISDISVSAYILLDEYNFCLDLKESILILDKSISFNASKLFVSAGSENFENITQFYQEDFFDDILEFFKLYYLASFESDLDISFLKFWMLSEKILKRILGSINDSKLINLMKKIIKMYGFPKFYLSRLKYLKIKRNKMVHESISEVNQGDRNLIKLVADCLILFLIQNFDKVNKIEEYGILLENWNFDNLNRKIELLEMINKEN